jgi:hypothetical protein
MSKSYDDLRQEVLVMQLISYFQHVFELEKLPLRLHPYRILSTGSSTGLIEVVRNAMSLDGIKKTPGFKNLRSHFEHTYGGATSSDKPGGEGAEMLRQAKLNFIHSLGTSCWLAREANWAKLTCGVYSCILHRVLYPCDQGSTQWQHYA